MNDSERISQGNGNDAKLMTEKRAGDAWTPLHAQDAIREGWDVALRMDDILEVERRDEWYGPDGQQKDGDEPIDPPFASDGEALVHCQARALSGSYLHLLAVMLDRKHKDDTIFVPFGMENRSNSIARSTEHDTATHR